MSAPVALATAEPLSGSGDGDQVAPKRVRELFARFDTSGDGKLTLDELRVAIGEEFPKLPAYAKAHIEPQFDKYAICAETEPCKYLDIPRFSIMYAAFLFRNFDADGNGVLDHAECEAALRYLANGKPVQVAVPEGAEEGKVGKPWFWAMYNAMMAD